MDREQLSSPQLTPVTRPESRLLGQSGIPQSSIGPVAVPSEVWLATHPESSDSDAEPTIISLKKLENLKKDVPAEASVGSVTELKPRVIDGVVPRALLAQAAPPKPLEGSTEAKLLPKKRDWDDKPTPIKPTIFRSPKTYS